MNTIATQELYISKMYFIIISEEEPVYTMIFCP